MIFGKSSVRIPAGTPAIMTEVFSFFSLYREEDVEIVAGLGQHDRFLANHFKFIIHLPSYHSNPYSVTTESTVKQTTIPRTEIVECKLPVSRYSSSFSFSLGRRNTKLITFAV
jgi:hypothetical protein